MKLKLSFFQGKKLKMSLLLIYKIVWFAIEKFGKIIFAEIFSKNKNLADRSG